MFYHSAILSAIDELRDCHLAGSSLSSIRHHVQASLPENKSFRDSAFLQSLKSAVDKGELVCVGRKIGDHYKLSTDYKKRRAESVEEEAEKLREEKRRRDRVHTRTKNHVVVAAGPK
eukprot:CAMPEP_0113575540 /NCGR_PEP_ID=MMETSP0015_2-20120614/27757_1 /TAXON_ID=2838 /ORGANISM="Odontella" /LENGTH=116 /DNA_ID=CAMNT_0000478795 /DNA_START=513 /DNA_END=860 /DNA_ORIENTATION=+ /assembly_acc=CAM_ASM_000160